MLKKVSSARGKSKGFTLLEMILVLAGMIAFLSIVFIVYRTKIEPSMWTNNKFQTLQSVVAAIENAKVANGGAYPAATNVDLGSTTTPTDPKGKLVWYAVTGGIPTADLSDWKYSCSGGNLDIQVNISDKPSNAAAGVFITSVQNNLRLTVAAGGETATSVTFRRGGVVCN